MRPDQGQKDIIVLLALILVHGGDFVGNSNQGIIGTPKVKKDI